MPGDGSSWMTELVNTAGGAGVGVERAWVLLWS